MAGLISLHSFIPIQPAADARGLDENSILEDFCRGCAWSEHDHTLLTEDREIMMHRSNAGTGLLPLLASPP